MESNHRPNKPYDWDVPDKLGNGPKRWGLDLIRTDSSAYLLEAMGKANVLNRQCYLCQTINHFKTDHLALVGHVNNFIDDPFRADASFAFV